MKRHPTGDAMFSALHLSSGYWQVGMDIAHKQKIAFVIREGLYLFKVMYFGLDCVAHLQPSKALWRQYLAEYNKTSAWST